MRTRTSVRIVSAWVVVGVLLAAAAYVATYRRADSVCSADPPGSDWSAYDSRTLDLWVNGWECRLIGVGDSTVGVQLGWWPTTDKMR